MPSSIQPTFAGGEFAPSLHSRVDLQKYATGLKTAKNFFIHPHGGASNRPGTKYIATVKDSTKKVRIVSFEFSTEQAYVIEFGNLYCRFYKDGGQIAASSPAAYNSGTAYVVSDYVTYSSVVYRCIQNGTNKTPNTETAYWTAQTIYEIATPYTEADLPDLKFAQSADVLYICHPEHAPKTLVRTAHDDWDLVAYDYTGGPFMPSNVAATTITPSATTGSGVTLTASASIFNVLHIGSLWRVRHSVPGSSNTTPITAVGATASLKCGSTWRIITHGAWVANLRVEKSLDAGSTWIEVRAFSSGGATGDFNANTYGEVTEPCLIRAYCSAFTSSASGVIDLSCDPFEQTGIVKITAYTSGTVVTGTVQTTLGATSATADWAEGSWSDYRGYPSCVTFYEDRLTFANTVSEPQTEWMTETGNYTSYDRSDPLVDSDGITVNLASRKMNGIRNLVPLSEILSLTSGAEWGVGAGASDVLAPTTVRTKQYGYRGSSKTEPVVVGNRAIYVLPQGSVVVDIGYDFNVSGFVGNNLSILSNHLFTGHKIDELAYQQEPDSLVWAIRDDGILLSMTYLREHEVIAWTRHETNGTVESICCIPGDGYDELWLAVKRGSSRFVERMEQRLVSTDPRKQFFVDAGLSLDAPKTITGATKADPVVVTATSHGFTDGNHVDIIDVVGMEDADGESQLNGRRFIVSDKTTHTFKLKDAESGEYVDGSDFTAYVSGGGVRKVIDTVTGLAHLNGFTVAVLANGSVQAEKTVSAGAITLDAAASIVHVGLAYTADFETLKPEIQMRDGTLQGRKARVAELTIRFLNSRGGWVGPDADNLTEINQRTTESLGSPIELFTGDDKESITPTFENGASVFYRQIDPLPVTILAVIPRIEIGG